MRTQYDQKTVDQFQTLLAQAEPNRRTRFSLREVIRESWTMIQQARERNVSWDTIVAILQQSIDANGHDVEISAITVRKYFSDFSEHKAQRKPRKSTSTQKKSRKAQSQETEQITQQSSPMSSSTSQAMSSLPIEAVPDPPKLETVVEIELPEPEETQTSPDSPGWTQSGWVEPAFNRNRARPKQEEKL